MGGCTWVDGGGVHGECSWCVETPDCSPGSGDHLVYAQVFLRVRKRTKSREERQREQSGAQRRTRSQRLKCAFPTGHSLLTCWCVCVCMCMYVLLYVCMHVYVSVWRCMWEWVYECSVYVIVGVCVCQCEWVYECVYMIMWVCVTDTEHQGQGEGRSRKVDGMLKEATLNLPSHLQQQSLRERAALGAGWAEAPPITADEDVQGRSGYWVLYQRCRDQEISGLLGSEVTGWQQ